MEESVKKTVLKDLFVIRTDGFQCLYDKKFKNINNRNVQLMDMIKEIIKDEEERRYIIEKCEECLNEEMNYWNLAYYKIGFMDGMSISEEIENFKNAMTG